MNNYFNNLENILKLSEEVSRIMVFVFKSFYLYLVSVMSVNMTMWRS